jgi:hypothetical protein
MDTYGLWAALFAGNMEEQGVLADDDIRDTVTVISDGTESPTSTDAVRMLLQI